MPLFQKLEDHEAFGRVHIETYTQFPWPRLSGKLPTPSAWVVLQSSAVVPRSRCHRRDLWCHAIRPFSTAKAIWCAQRLAADHVRCSTIFENRDCFDKSRWRGSTTADALGSRRDFSLRRRSVWLLCIVDGIGARDCGHHQNVGWLDNSSLLTPWQRFPRRLPVFSVQRQTKCAGFKLGFIR